MVPGWTAVGKSTKKIRSYDSAVMGSALSANRWDSLLLLELSAVWKATLEKSCVDIDKFQGSSKRTVSCAVVL